MDYTPSSTKLRAKVKLLKPTQATVTGLSEDYNLSEYFEKPIDVQTLEGNHITILDNEKVAEVINSCLLEWLPGNYKMFFINLLIMAHKLLFLYNKLHKIKIVNFFKVFLIN